MRFRSRAFALLIVAGAVAIPLPFNPTVISANQYIVPEGERAVEDAYVLANRAVIEGRIDGDLSFAGGDVVVSGFIDGDLNVASSAAVRIEGTVNGSVRGAVLDQVEVIGVVNGDVAVATRRVSIEGEVGRDILLFGAQLEMEGTVGRDIRGQLLTASLNGEVGAVVDVRVNQLTIGPDARIAGDVIYRSTTEASVSNQAELLDGLSQFPATQRAEVELAIAAVTILGFLGFLVAGIALLWLFRRTAPRAIEAIPERPLLTLGVGFGAVVGIPLLCLALVATLVGLPVALILLALYALGWLVVAPVPSVTVLGDRIFRSRRSLFASFVLGAVILRVVFWVPWIGGFIGLALYLSAVTWGFGGWLVAAWEQRAESLDDARPLVPMNSNRDGGEAAEIPDDWEPPLPPA